MAAVEPAVCNPNSDESRRALISNVIPYSESVERPAKPLVEMVAKLRKYGTWPKELEGEPKTWERFCSEVLGRPAGWFDDLEHGVSLLTGATIGQAVDIGAKVAAAKDKPLASNGEIGNGRSFDNLKATKGGNDTDYTLRRLARDAPDLLDKIEAGELSVNQAAIKAGIREIRQVYIPRDPVMAAAKLQSQFGEEFARSVGRLIDTPKPQSGGKLHDLLQQVMALDPAQKAVIFDHLQIEQDS